MSDQPQTTEEPDWELLAIEQGRVIERLGLAMRDVLRAANREVTSSQDARLRLITIATYARTALQGDCS